MSSRAATKRVTLEDDVVVLEGIERENRSATRMHLEVGAWEGHRVQERKHKVLNC
jgi:hypothetical protein